MQQLSPNSTNHLDQLWEFWMVPALLLALPELQCFHASICSPTFRKFFVLQLSNTTNYIKNKKGNGYLSMHEEACTSIKSAANMFVQTGHSCISAVEKLKIIIFKMQSTVQYYTIYSEKPNT